VHGKRKPIVQEKTFDAQLTRHALRIPEKTNTTGGGIRGAVDAAKPIRTNSD
jgi:hypothetical protein